MPSTEVGLTDDVLSAETPFAVSSSVNEKKNPREGEENATGRERNHIELEKDQKQEIKREKK